MQKEVVKCSLFCTLIYRRKKNEPPQDQTNKMACAPSEDSDQPGHPPSLIRVFGVCMMKALVLSYLLSAQQSLWSDWADAQANLNLRWAHIPFCWFCHEAAQMFKSSFCRYNQIILVPSHEEWRKSMKKNNNKKKQKQKKQKENITKSAQFHR